MKHFVIPFMAAAMLAGCAIQSSKSKMQEADFMQDNLNVYGAYRADVVGVISWSQEDRCDKTAFKLYARKEKNIDKVVDIITKETCLSDPGAMNTNCKCEYSGVGMKYTQLDVSEAAAWGAIPNNGGLVSADNSASNSVSGPANESMVP